MNDLERLKELGQDVQLPGRHELGQARARLVAAIEGSRPAGRSRRSRRPLLVAALAAGLAVAVAVVVTRPAAPTQPHKVPIGAPAGETAGPRSSTPPSEAPRTVTAATVLRMASAAAAAQNFVEPRPDQFLYIESRLGGGTRRDWLSVDGTRDSLLAQHGSDPGVVQPGCRNGLRDRLDPDGNVAGQEPCQPEPAYLPNAPTNAQYMLTYLESLGGHPGTNSLAKNVLSLALWHYLRPQARAALYDAAALIPGIEMVPDVVDGAGRPGVGVGWSYGGGRTVMVFDPNTHALLGFERSEAIITMAIVDEVGQSP